jgi:hypothetical protein
LTGVTSTAAVSATLSSAQNSDLTGEHMLDGAWAAKGRIVMTGGGGAGAEGGGVADAGEASAAARALAAAAAISPGEGGAGPLQPAIVVAITAPHAAKDAREIRRIFTRSTSPRRISRAGSGPDRNPW